MADERIVSKPLGPEGEQTWDRVFGRRKDVGELLDYELYCTICRRTTKFISDKLEMDGRYETITCGHCNTVYMVHKVSSLQIPKVYKLTSTGTFVRKAEDRNHGEEGNSKEETVS